MLKNEATWIAQELETLDDSSLFPFVNLGSSSARFREVDQPFIDELIFAPLRKRAGTIYHVDAKPAPGVDTVVDFSLATAWESISALQPRFVLCSNVFEHVVDRALLAQRLLDVMRPGTYLLVTAPYAFPYHPDPIDTRFRPTPAELAELFPDLLVVRQAQIDGARLWQLLHGQTTRLAKKAFDELRISFRNVSQASETGTVPSDAKRVSLFEWAKYFVIPFRSSCVLLVRPKN